MIIYLFLTILVSPLTAIHMYPLDHITATYTTNLIIKFLYNNKTIPIAQLDLYTPTVNLLKNSNQCQICNKSFTNSSYLAMHYSIKHQNQLFQYFDQQDTVNLQIIFNPNPNLPTPQIYQHCLHFYATIQQRITNNKTHRFPYYYTYVSHHSGSQFCQIVANRLYEEKVWENVVQVLGFATLIIIIISYILYSAEIQQKEARIKKSKIY